MRIADQRSYSPGGATLLGREEPLGIMLAGTPGAAIRPLK